MQLEKILTITAEPNTEIKIIDFDTGNTIFTGSIDDYIMYNSDISYNIYDWRIEEDILIIRVMQNYT